MNIKLKDRSLAILQMEQRQSPTPADCLLLPIFTLNPRPGGFILASHILELVSWLGFFIHLLRFAGVDRSAWLPLRAFTAFLPYSAQQILFWLYLQKRHVFFIRRGRQSQRRRSILQCIWRWYEVDPNWNILRRKNDLRRNIANVSPNPFRNSKADIRLRMPQRRLLRRHLHNMPINRSKRCLRPRREVITIEVNDITRLLRCLQIDQLVDPSLAFDQHTLSTGSCCDVVVDFALLAEL